MKTTLKQIIAAQPALQKLQTVQALPVKADYAVSKLARACDAEIEQYNAVRKKRFEAAGCTVNVEKNAYVHPEGEDKLKQLAEEIDQVLDVEIEINALALDLDLFGNHDVPGGSFYGLDWAMKPEL